MSVDIDIKELFVSGAHFGHKTSRWHPKMAPFIHSERNGIHVINLEETVKGAQIALKVIAENAANDRQILFVSTKQQAEMPIREAAKVHEQPYVVNRWMGGLLTNNKTIKERIKHLKDLEKKMNSGELGQRYSKLEVQRYQEEIDILNEKFGGIKEMAGLPGLVFVVDINKDSIAVKEAKKLGIPTIGFVDSNSDPNQVDYPVPANDDAVKTIELILGYVNSAVSEGKTRPKPKSKQAPANTSTDVKTAKPQAKPTAKVTTPKKSPVKKPATKKVPAKTKKEK